MEESTVIMDAGAIARGQIESVLEVTLREGARRLLQEALELEVEQYTQRFQQLRDDKGKRLVVHNGYHQERELVASVGQVLVRQALGEGTPRIMVGRQGDTLVVDPQNLQPGEERTVAQALLRVLVSDSRDRDP